LVQIFHFAAQCFNSWLCICLLLLKCLNLLLGHLLLLLKTLYIFFFLLSISIASYQLLLSVLNLVF
jgi:hypothetical protein